jgi:hypothetical protein
MRLKRAACLMLLVSGSFVCAAVAQPQAPPQGAPLPRPQAPPPVRDARRR